MYGTDSTFSSLWLHLVIRVSPDVRVAWDLSTHRIMRPPISAERKEDVFMRVVAIVPTHLPNSQYQDDLVRLLPHL